MKFYRCLENSLLKNFENKIFQAWIIDCKWGIVKLKWNSKRWDFIGCAQCSFLVDKWLFDKTKGWKLIQFNPKIKTKVIFKHLIDLWCHGCCCCDKFTNERESDILSLFSFVMIVWQITGIRNYFSTNICSSYFLLSFFLPENVYIHTHPDCSRCECRRTILTLISILSNIFRWQYRYCVPKRCVVD